jgi:hypothetical protein
MVIQVIASAGRFGGTEAYFAKLAAFMVTIRANTGETTPVDDGCTTDELGRVVDQDGNIYDEHNIVTGNIHGGED